MNFYPAWPPLVTFVGMFWLADISLFASADAPPAPRPTRLQTIDGLRGFLALSVVLFHGALYHRYLSDGTWGGPLSSGYILLGTGGVGVFFMITGYLFWCRVIDEQGRPDWARLYVGRVFRIAPLYLVAIFAMVVLVMISTGWQLRVPVTTFVKELAPWLALGLLGPTDLNGHPATLILIAGVTWSLRYEWLFYLTLPVIALAAGSGSVRLGVALVAMAAGFLWSFHGGPYLFGPGDPSFATLFLIGIACACADRSGWAARIDDRLASVVVVALIALLFRICQIAYWPLAMALLGACFYLVISGCTIFGILTRRASKRLGDISYGIYLLQGLVLAALFQFRSIRVFALTSPLRHWLVVLGATALLVCLAALSHTWIERPGIVLGKRIARLLPISERRRASIRRSVVAHTDRRTGARSAETDTSTRSGS